jgi:SagB-type dehydrogenase family enzyme
MHEEEIYSAAGLTEAAERLPELALPAQPRFVEDLLCVNCGGGIYVLGAEPQFLGGATIGLVFDKLLPLLSGQRTVDEIALDLPELSHRALTDILTLLMMHGLIEEGAVKTPKTPLPDSEILGQSAFYSRYLRVTGRYTNRGGPLDRLASAYVCVALTDGRMEASARTLERGLLEHGVGTVSIASGLDAAGVCGEKADLVLAVGSFSEQQALQAALARRDCPVLFLDLACGLLGPYTVPRISACPDCVRLQIGEQLPDPSAQNHADEGPFRLVLLQRTVLRAITTLTGLFGTEHITVVELWDERTRATKRFDSVLALPNCPSCGADIVPRSLRLPSGHEENVSLLYHRGTAIKPWDLGNAALVQRHLQPSILRLARAHIDPWLVVTEELPRDVTSLPDDPTELSRPLIGCDRVGPARRCTLATLGPLLRYSAGGVAVRIDRLTYHINRFTASGGNLGSAHVYVVARDVEGLRPGVYRYEPLNHQLHLLPRNFDSAKVDARWAHPDLASRPQAVLIVACDIGVTFQKYGGRCFIYSLLDAGLMAQRLAQLAESLGHHTTLAWDFEDNAVLNTLGQQTPEYGVGCLLALVG